MAYLEWSSQLSVSVDEFDRHHKKLVDLINKLYDAMSQGKAAGIIGKTLVELVDYTKYHFATEERQMKLHDYPGLAQHKTEHDAFVSRIEDFRARFDSGSAGSTSIKVMYFLKDWLINHIQATDRQYSGFFSTRKVA